MGGLSQADVAALGGYQGPPPASPISSDATSQSPPPASTGQWESVPQTNQYGRVPPDLPLEQPQQPQNDPFQTVLGPMYARLKQLTPANPQPIAGGVKGFIQHFLQGGGEALMHSVGVLTPDEEKQQLTQQIAAVEGRRESWMNTQSEIAFRQQQIAAFQQQQQFQRQMQPLQLQHEQLLNQTEEFNLNQSRANVPTVQPVMDAETAKVAGIPDRFVGQPFSEANWKIVDDRIRAKGFSRFDTGIDDPRGNDPHKGEWIVDRYGNPYKQTSRVSTSGRATALMKAQIAANAPPKPGSLLVGTTPDGRQVAGTQEELQSVGVTNATKLGAAEAEKTNVARQLTSSNGLFSMVDSDLAQFKPEELTTIGAHWNEFITGRIGTGDTRYAALRTHMGLLSTALMQAHVGSRGSVQMMDHFKGLADAGKMNGDILKSSIAAEKQYVEEKDLNSSEWRLPWILQCSNSTGDKGLPLPILNARPGKAGIVLKKVCKIEQIPLR